MNSFRTEAYLQPHIIDKRNLRMDADFFLLTKEEVISLLHSFVKWCNAAFNDSCITSWINDNGRRTKYERIIDEISKKAHIGVAVGFEGVVRSEIIYNKRTFHAFAKRHAFAPSNGIICDFSADYMDFYHSQRSRLVNGEISWKEAVLSFFNEPKRKCYMTASFPDFQGGATCFQHSGNPNLFHGTLCVTISVYCLGQNISGVAERMSRFLIQQAEIYRNLNGNVTVTPTSIIEHCCGHMNYFGHDVSIDNSHLDAEVEPQEWYPHYYICGAEWFNLISPLARERVPLLMQKSLQYPSLQCRELQNKGIIIQVNLSPEQMDVDDLRPVKHLLYEGLYPGMHRIPKDEFLDAENLVYFGKPRRFWECVPVFDDEVIVTDEDIILKHGNCRILD